MIIINIKMKIMIKRKIIEKKVRIVTIVIIVIIMIIL